MAAKRRRALTSSWLGVVPADAKLFQSLRQRSDPSLALDTGTLQLGLDRLRREQLAVKDAVEKCLGSQRRFNRRDVE